ncbi:hypothetical protein FQZ97_1274090 [compost metagenome]
MPLSSTSSPLPPSSRSSPAWPNNWSLPPRPKILSSPSVPTMMSLPSVPAVTKTVLLAKSSTVKFFTPRNFTVKSLLSSRPLSSWSAISQVSPWRTV